MSEKSIEAIVVGEQSSQREQIIFDQETGLIIEYGQLGISSKDIDFNFSDDCRLFPGMGDIHIHAREDTSGEHKYKEDYESAAMAALNGGVTFACDMPNNPIAPICNKSYLDKLNLCVDKKIAYEIYAGIGPGTKPLSMRVPYKAYMGPSVGELFFKNIDQLEQTIKFYKNCDVSFHCEDPEILEMHSNEKNHFLRRPIEAELLATQQALDLIEKYELKGKLCHYSAGQGLDLIRNYRKKGVQVEVEVTPQHLFFSAEELLGDRIIHYQMNPPIRSEEDREKMLEAFIGGEINYLATDHAPHTWEEKLRGTSGLTGLDTFGLFVCWLINEKKVSEQLILKTCCHNPGNFFNTFLPSLKKLNPWYNNLGKGLGRIDKDFYANFTILNLNSSFSLTKQHIKSKAAWSPFVGHTFPGKVEAVFFGGKMSHE